MCCSSQGAKRWKNAVGRLTELISRKFRVCWDQGTLLSAIAKPYSSLLFWGPFFLGSVFFRMYQLRAGRNLHRVRLRRFSGFRRWHLHSSMVSIFKHCIWMKCVTQTVDWGGGPNPSLIWEFPRKFNKWQYLFPFAARTHFENDAILNSKELPTSKESEMQHRCQTVLIMLSVVLGEK